jgi:DNA modification methylase
MTELPNNFANMVLTSLPYLNIKNYPENGYQTKQNCMARM